MNRFRCGSSCMDSQRPGLWKKRRKTGREERKPMSKEGRLWRTEWGSDAWRHRRRWRWRIWAYVSLTEIVEMGAEGGRESHGSHYFGSGLQRFLKLLLIMEYGNWRWRWICDLLGSTAVRKWCLHVGNRPSHVFISLVTLAILHLWRVGYFCLQMSSVVFVKSLCNSLEKNWWFRIKHTS